MKKIIVGLGLVLTMLICIIGNVYAADCSINLQTTKEEFDKGEEVVINVVVSGLKTSKGVAALMASLEYDADSLTLVKMEGQNGWATPNYNDENGKLITDKNNNLTGTETILKFTFKVKESAKQNLVITLKNITVSGGTGDIAITRAYKEMKVKNGTVNPKPNPGEDDKDPIIPDGNNTTDNTIQTPDNNTNQVVDNNTTNEELNVIHNQTENNKDTTNEKLPQTGGNNTILTVGIIGTVSIAAIFFMRMVIINRKLR